MPSRMKKISRRASRLFRREEPRIPPTIIEEYQDNIAILPELPHSPASSGDAGCLRRLKSRRRKSSPAYIIVPSTDISVVSLTAPQIPEMEELMRQPRKVQSMVALSTYHANLDIGRPGPNLQSVDEAIFEDTDASSVIVNTHSPVRRFSSMSNLRFSSSTETIDLINTRNMVVNSSPPVREAVDLPRSSSGTWTTTSDGATSPSVRLTWQPRRPLVASPARGVVSFDLPKPCKPSSAGPRFKSDGAVKAPGRWSRGGLLPQTESGRTILDGTPHGIRRDIRRLPSDVVARWRSVSGEATRTSPNVQLVEEQQDELEIDFSIPSPKLPSEKGRDDREQSTTRAGALQPQDIPAERSTNWADMDSSFDPEDTVSLRRLQADLRLPSGRISTPDLSSYRRHRAAAEAREASVRALPEIMPGNAFSIRRHNAVAATAVNNAGQNEAFANEAFFNRPRRGGGWGDLESLSSDDISVDPEVLRHPLPMNVIENLHDTARRLDTEFARLRLNTRVLKQNESAALERMEFLRARLQDLEIDLEREVEVMREVIVEMDRLGMEVPQFDADGELEPVGGETSYEGDESGVEESSAVSGGPGDERGHDGDESDIVGFTTFEEFTGSPEERGDTEVSPLLQ